jgi:Uma2 family endonuclease
MSTAPRPRSHRTTPPKDNPYFYGWREVPSTDERGRPSYVLQPLTEEEILHPRLGDHVTQNPPHAEDAIYLKYVFTAQVSTIPGAQVFFDALIVWDIPGLGDHSPDVMVVFGAQQRDRESFNVAEEGVRPELIVEVTSPATRNNDLNRKPGEYWRARVPYYVIVDATRRRGKRYLTLIGYQRGARRYRRMKPDAQGRLWLESVRLWLGQENERVVCYDEQGQRVETFTEVQQARQAAKELAAQQQERAEAAEERLRQMEAELRRLRGEEE